MFSWVRPETRGRAHWKSSLSSEMTIRLIFSQTSIQSDFRGVAPCRTSLVVHSLLYLWFVWVSDVVQVRHHEAPELLVPRVLQTADDVSDGRSVRALHQNQESCYTLFYGAVIIPVHLHEHISDLWPTTRGVTHEYNHVYTEHFQSQYLFILNLMPASRLKCSGVCLWVPAVQVFELRSWTGVFLCLWLQMFQWSWLYSCAPCHTNRDAALTCKLRSCGDSSPPQPRGITTASTRRQSTLNKLRGGGGASGSVWASCVDAVMSYVHDDGSQTFSDSKWADESDMSFLDCFNHSQISLCERCVHVRERLYLITDVHPSKGLYGCLLMW